MFWVNAGNTEQCCAVTYVGLDKLLAQSVTYCVLVSWMCGDVSNTIICLNYFCEKCNFDLILIVFLVVFHLCALVRLQILLEKLINACIEEWLLSLLWLPNGIFAFIEQSVENRMTIGQTYPMAMLALCVGVLAQNKGIMESSFNRVKYNFTPSIIIILELKVNILDRTMVDNIVKLYERYQFHKPVLGVGSILVQSSLRDVIMGLRAQITRVLDICFVYKDREAAMAYLYLYSMYILNRVW